MNTNSWFARTRDDLLKQLRTESRHVHEIPATVTLIPEVRLKILNHIRREAPHIAMGLLAGTSGQGTYVRPLRNVFVHERALHQFLPDPDDWNRAIQEIAHQGQEIVATYQSVTSSIDELSPTILAAWKGRPGTLYLTVHQDEFIRFHAWIVVDNRAHEIPIFPGGIEEDLDIIRQQFETNPCLSLYTWIEAYNRSLLSGDWPGAHRLLEEFKSGAYPLWPAAQQAVATQEQMIRRQEQGTPGDKCVHGLEFLIQMTHDQSRIVRRDAIFALERLNQYQALQHCVEHSIESVQIMAAVALQRCGSEGLEILRKETCHHHWFVRWQAIEQIGKHGDASDTAYLIKALEDRDVDVRASAISGLGKMPGHSVIANLCALLPTSIRTSNGFRLDMLIQNALLKLGVNNCP